MRWLIAVGLLWISSPLVWGSATVEVAPGKSIQEAIDAAPPGAVIQLPEGTWRENLVIDKNLVIRGQGAENTTIVAAQVGHPVITVSPTQTASVTLEGLKITGGTGDCADPSLGTCAHGILVLGDAQLTLISCQVVDNVTCGLFAAGSCRITIMDTTFSGNQTGLWAHSQARVKLQKTTLSGNTYGLIGTGQAVLTVEESTISDSDRDGILVADGVRLYLWNSRVTGNGRVGVCLDIPGCYRTNRTFSGLVRGAGNTVPRSDEDAANGLAPFCPQELGFLRSELGGIFPAQDPAALSSRLGLSLPPLGSPEAPVSMLEFSDFSCPYCARFALETLPQLREEYIDPGRVALYCLPFPVHGEAAKLEAQAAFCAAAQGLYWEFQEAAFAYAKENGYPELGAEDLAQILGSVGGDPEGLLACLSDGAYAGVVEEVIDIAHELGVRGTPTFFVGELAVPGAYPYQVFRGILDWVLGQK
jgi:protein-disulfide isomerase